MDPTTTVTRAAQCHGLTINWLLYALLHFYPSTLIGKMTIGIPNLKNLFWMEKIV